MSSTYGAPLPRALVLLAAALICAAGAFALTPLWAPAAVLLLLAARDLRCRRALVLTPDGLRYIDGLHHSDAAWTEVTAVRVRAERHFLAFGRHLEIDLADDTLVVLSSAQLGADAEEVAQAVESARGGVRPPGTRPPF